MLAPIPRQLSLKGTELESSSELGRWNVAEKQTENPVIKLKTDNYINENKTYKPFNNILKSEGGFSVLPHLTQLTNCRPVLACRG